MSKRKLNRRQAWRVEQIQNERVKRAQSKTDQAEDLIRDQKTGPEQMGRIVAHYGANLDVEDAQQVTHHCLVRANLPALVCGDKVIWQSTGSELGVITSLVPRNSLLARPDYHGNLKPVASNVDQILIVAAPQPGVDEDMINRYLVAAELTSIKPIIVINKTDLLTDAIRKTLSEQLAMYEQIGYQTIYTSTMERNGLNELINELADKTSIFVGQSGVGKSSLIKIFIPNADIRVGELSKSTGLGKHTTSVTVLYHLDKGGDIIDSPGVREFGLGNVSKEQLAQGFVEFAPYLGACKFKDCKHLQEPDCAIKNAVDHGEINQQRYNSFQRLVKNLSKS